LAYEKTLDKVADGLSADYVVIPLAPIEVKYYQITKELDKEIIEYINLLFGDATDEAILVIRCESQFKEKVVSRTSDVGLFQINLTVHGWRFGDTRAEQIEYLQDRKNNIDYAHKLYLQSGWSHWYMSDHCHGL